MCTHNFSPRLFLLLPLAAILITGCHRKESDEDSDSSSVHAVVAVHASAVEIGKGYSSVEGLGRTDALRKEKIYAPIAGRIVSLKALEGTDVKRGEILAVIQTKESESAILGAEAILQSAKTAEQKAEAQRTLDLARSTGSSVTVAAKFDGVVSSRSVSEGELVAENAEVCTIVDLSTVDFLADVRLRDVQSVHRGQSALITFSSLPGKPLPATVDAVSPQSDIQSQTVRVRLQFAIPRQAMRAQLRTDMIGTAKIVTGVRRQAMFVPASAVLRNDEDNSYSVLSVTPDSIARVVPVVVAGTMDSTVEVQSESLHRGMLVITQGNYHLADSTRVIVTP